MMVEITLAQELLSEYGGDPFRAAVAMARLLMQDDPETFKAGYSLENAAIAAAEYMGVDRQPVQDALEAQ